VGKHPTYDQFLDENNLPVMRQYIDRCDVPVSDWPSRLASCSAKELAEGTPINTREYKAGTLGIPLVAAITTVLRYWKVVEGCLLAERLDLDTEPPPSKGITIILTHRLSSRDGKGHPGNKLPDGLPWCIEITCSKKKQSVAVWTKWPEELLHSLLAMMEAALKPLAMTKRTIQPIPTYETGFFHEMIVNTQLLTSWIAYLHSVSPSDGRRYDDLDAYQEYRRQLNEPFRDTPKADSSPLHSLDEWRGGSGGRSAGRNRGTRGTYRPVER